MPRSSRRWEPHAIFHVDARAHGGVPMLAAEADRAFIVGRAARVFAEMGITCLGWSILANHYHLLLRCPESPGRALLRLNTAIARRVRRNCGGAGAVFQGRFFSGMCTDEGSLLRRLAYVTANPLRHGVVSSIDALRSYPWSSLGEVLAEREARLVDSAAVLAILDPAGSPTRARQGLLDLIAMRASVWSGADGDPDDDAEPTDVRIQRRVRDEIRSPVTLGVIAGPVPRRLICDDDLAARRQVLRSQGWTPALLVEAACEACDLRAVRFRTARRTVAVCRVRAAVAHAACDILGWPAVEVAASLGISGPSVSAARRRGASALAAIGLTAEELIRASRAGRHATVSFEIGTSPPAGASAPRATHEPEGEGSAAPAGRA